MSDEILDGIADIILHGDALPSAEETRAQGALTAGGKFEYQPTCLVVHGTPTRDEWLAAYDGLMGIGRELEAMKDQWRWNVGDMLVYGEGKFGEDYAQAVGYKEQTVRNIMTVCRQLSPDRRRLEVGFWTHYEVIGLPPEQQDALLERAAQEQLTKLEVRTEKRLLRGVAPMEAYKVRGKNPDRDVHGVKPVLVTEYWPETESGELPHGFVEITIRPCE